jgi:O-methyltransferase involved in polyketide biosynthesis
MPTDDAAAAGAESSADAHGTVNAVGGTCLITAAFRAIDLQFSTSPIVIDPLASHLGRAVWDTAHKDW